MKLYLVIRTDNVGYDEYDSWIVCAKNADAAGNFTEYNGRIVITPIGEAYPEQKAGIILGSFNAG